MELETMPRKTSTYSQYCINKYYMLRQDFFWQKTQSGQYISVAKVQQYVKKHQLSPIFKQLFIKLFESNYLQQNPYFKMHRLMSLHAFNDEVNNFTLTDSHRQYDSILDIYKHGPISLKFIQETSLPLDSLIQLLSTPITNKKLTQTFSVGGLIFLGGVSFEGNSNFFQVFHVITGQCQQIGMLDNLSTRIIKKLQALQQQHFVLVSRTIFESAQDRIEVSKGWKDSPFRKSLVEGFRISFELICLQKTYFAATYHILFKADINGQQLNSYANQLPVFISLYKQVEDRNRELDRVDENVQLFNSYFLQYLKKRFNLRCLNELVLYLKILVSENERLSRYGGLIETLQQSGILRLYNLSQKIDMILQFIKLCLQIQKQKQSIIYYLVRIQLQIYQELQQARYWTYPLLLQEIRALLVNCKVNKSFALNNSTVQTFSTVAMLLAGIAFNHFQYYLLLGEKDSLAPVFRFLGYEYEVSELITNRPMTHGFNIDEQVNERRKIQQQSQFVISDQVMISYILYYHITDFFFNFRELVFGKLPVYPFSAFISFIQRRAQYFYLFKGENKNKKLTLNGLSVAVPGYSMPFWEHKLKPGKSIVAFMDTMLYTTPQQIFKINDFIAFLQQACKRTVCGRGYSINVVCSVSGLSALRASKKLSQSCLSLDADVFVRGNHQQNHYSLFYEFNMSILKVLDQLKNFRFVGYFSQRKQKRPVYSSLPKVGQFIKLIEMTKKSYMGIIVEEQQRFKLILIALNLYSIKDKVSKAISLKQNLGPQIYHKIFFKKADFSLFVDLVNPKEARYQSLAKDYSNWDYLISQLIFTGLSKIESKQIQNKQIKCLNHRMHRLLFYESELTFLYVIFGQLGQQQQIDKLQINLDILVQQFFIDFQQASFGYLDGIFSLLQNQLNEMNELLMNRKLKEISELAYRSANIIRTVLWYYSARALSAMRQQKLD